MAHALTSIRIITAKALFVFAETAALAEKLANCVLYVVADVVAGESSTKADADGPTMLKFVPV